MADLTLVDWAEKREAWARDALRRHALSPGSRLSAADKAGILARVRHHAGFKAGNAPSCEPLTVSHLGSKQADDRRTVLCSLGPVKNLNRIATGNQLNFAVDGITLVYGDNGSGKSGYARVTKKICRSLSADDLLGNVFEAGTHPPAEVRIRYRLEGDQQPTAVDWIDGTPPPPPVSGLSVFDSQNARFYVDRHNRIAFPPKELAILQGHGSHCTEMDAAFKKEIANIERRTKTPLPGGYASDGEAAKLIGRLDVRSKESLPTVQELENAATWNEEYAKQLAELDQVLAHDPKALAAQARRAKSLLDSYAELLAAIEVLLSPQALDDFRRLCERAKAAIEAASIAATDRFAAEPLPDVGQSAWRLMYDYAKDYATSVGRADGRLPDNVGDACMLCQEPLSDNGARRLQSFNEFVAGTASKAASEARAAREEAVANLQAVQAPAKHQIVAAFAEFSVLGESEKNLADDIQSYMDIAIRRRDALVKGSGMAEFHDMPELAASLSGRIQDSVKTLEHSAKAYDEVVTSDGGRAPERARQAALRDRKKLSEDLLTIRARLDDLNEISLLRECVKTVETKPISLQLTALRRGLVMQELEARIRDEIVALGLGDIPFSVSDHSAEGESYFGVGLDALQDAESSKVLSEGEQRALALACFLGEVGAADSKNGLIVDDPVSSLDHIRIRRVADRLVQEAKAGRQIIVFTHNILFFNEIKEASARASVPVLQNFIRKSSSEGFGIVSQTEEPWVLMPVAKRINVLHERLKGFGNVSDFDTDEWRRAAKDFYTDLRETWERLVEEALLYRVVERFNTDVKTQSLKGVVVEDSDYKTIYWAMRRVSERSGHDMAPGRVVPVPTPQDMAGDLAEIDTFRRSVVERRKDAEIRRKALEDPPKAAVA